MSSRNEVLGVDALERTGEQLVKERSGRDCRCVGCLRSEWLDERHEWLETWTLYYETVGDAEPSYYDITTMPDSSLWIRPIEQKQIPYSLIGRPVEQ